MKTIAHLMVVEDHPKDLPEKIVVKSLMSAPLCLSNETRDFPLDVSLKSRLLDSANVQILYSSCITCETNSLFVEYLIPIQGITFEPAPRERLTLYGQLIELFGELEEKDFILCDLQRGQFGYSPSEERIKLFDYESIVYTEEPLGSNSKCKTDEDCHQYYLNHQPVCLISQSKTDTAQFFLEDFGCNQATGYCSGLDQKTQVWKAMKTTFLRGIQPLFKEPWFNRTNFERMEKNVFARNKKDRWGWEQIRDAWSHFDSEAN